MEHALSSPDSSVPAGHTELAGDAPDNSPFRQAAQEPQIATFTMEKQDALLRDQRRRELDWFKQFDLVDYAKRHGYGKHKTHIEHSGEYWRLHRASGDQIIIKKNGPHWVWINP